MNVSTVRKIGIAGRLAARYAGKNRVAAAAWKGLRTTAVSFGRVLGILWLEVTGFVFLCLAGIGGMKLASEYSKYQAGKGNSGRIALAVCFTLTFAWFGVSSFWRARRKG
ncbi:MAG: hypothetical protein DMG68_07065 [Acidobacteria bacterium]|nr:MAG: hypothetical protein DMG68_07065 [Acidobacteriota bacterium]